MIQNFKAQRKQLQKRYGSKGPRQILQLAKTDQDVRMLLQQISLYYHHSIQNKRQIYLQIGKKFTKQLQQQGIQPSEAAASLFMDGFWQFIKQNGSKAFNVAKDLYKKYRQPIHQALGSLLQKQFGVPRQISDMGIHGVQQLVNTAFGGSINSQDPYSVSTKFMLGLSGLRGQLHHLGRLTDHPLGQLSSTSIFDITTNANGEALCGFNASAMFSPTSNYINTNWMNFLPYYFCSSSATQPFNAILPPMNPGPYTTMIDQIVSQSADCTIVSYYHMQSLAYTRGVVHVGVFADWPNQSWIPTDSASSYRVPRNCNISPQDFSNNAMRYQAFTLADFVLSNRQSTQPKSKVQHFLCRVFDQTPSRQLHKNQEIFDQSIAPRYPLILFLFTGCTQNSKIGQFQFDQLNSIQPIASRRKLFNTKIRGTYQGSHKLLKQMYKNGNKINFMSPMQFSSHIVSNFAQYNSNLLKFGQGQAIQIPSYHILFDPKSSGLCVYESFKFLGIQVPKKAWLTLQQIKNYTNQYAVVVGERILNLPQNLEPFVVLSIKQKHAWVVASDLYKKQETHVFNLTTQNCLFDYIDKLTTNHQMPVLMGQKGFIRAKQSTQYGIQYMSNNWQWKHQVTVQEYMQIKPYIPFFFNITSYLTISQNKAHIQIGQDRNFSASAFSLLLQNGLHTMDCSYWQYKNQNLLYYINGKLANIIPAISYKDFVRKTGYIPVYNQQQGKFVSWNAYSDFYIKGKQSSKNKNKKTQVKKEIGKPLNNNVKFTEYIESKKIPKSVRRAIQKKDFQNFAKKPTKNEIDQIVAILHPKQQQAVNKKKKTQPKIKQKTPQSLKIFIDQRINKAQLLDQNIDNARLILKYLTSTSPMGLIAKTMTNFMKLQLRFIYGTMIYLSPAQLQHGLLKLGYRIVTDIPTYAKYLRLYLNHTIDYKLQLIQQQHRLLVKFDQKQAIVASTMEYAMKKLNGG